MSTKGHRVWTAHVVLTSDHKGLNPYFKRVEDKMYRCLAMVEDPRDVRLFLEELSLWLERHRDGVLRPIRRARELPLR